MSTILAITFNYDWQINVARGMPPQTVGPSRNGGNFPPSPSFLKLSDCIKNVLAKYYKGMDLNNIQIHPEGLPSYIAPGNRAFTLGNDVYFEPGQYKPNDLDGILLMGHEFTHTEQYFRLSAGGLSVFPLLYVGQAISATKLALGMKIAGVNASVAKVNNLVNKYEKEANARAQRIKNDLNGQNPCPP